MSFESYLLSLGLALATIQRLHPKSYTSTAHLHVYWPGRATYGKLIADRRQRRQAMKVDFRVVLAIFGGITVVIVIPVGAFIVLAGGFAAAVAALTALVT